MDMAHTANTTPQLPEDDAPCIMELELEPGAELTAETNKNEKCFAFLLHGNAYVDGQLVEEKTAVLFGGGDTLTLTAPDDAPVSIILCSGMEGMPWPGSESAHPSSGLAQALRAVNEGEPIEKRPEA